MEIRYLKIFTDKLVLIEKDDGTRLNGIIETAANDLETIDSLLPIQREHTEITISVTDGMKDSTKILAEVSLQIKNIFSIEIMA